jgi:hypothetical protein
MNLDGRRASYDELAAVAEQCRTPNWDGFNAFPIEQETLRLACSLLEALPLGVAAPSVGAEPDGHVTLEWHQLPRRTLSMSVDPGGFLHYSGLFGPNRRYGTEVSCGELPATILSLINEVYE